MGLGTKTGLQELEGLLLWEAIEEPHEADLVGKAKPVMRSSAPAELHIILLGQGRGSLELVAGKHCRCDTANVEVGKDASLAHKITPYSVNGILHESAQYPDSAGSRL
jgi:hypothetical protein